MKIAVSTLGSDLEAPVDPRFGRAPAFLIYDTEAGTFVMMENTKNLSAPQGAGIQSAQNVASVGARAVITGHTGPKAFQVLRAAGISVHPSEGTTVAQALEAYRAGKLPQMEEADVEGHW